MNTFYCEEFENYNRTVLSIEWHIQSPCLYIKNMRFVSRRTLFVSTCEINSENSSFFTTQHQDVTWLIIYGIAKANDI